MADKKISQLTSATTPLAGTEVFPIVQSNTTVKTPVSSVLTSGLAANLGATTITGTASIETSSFPALTLTRNLNVSVVGDAGQALALGAKNGTTPTTGADILGILESGGVTGRFGIRTLTGGSLTQKVTVASGGDFTVNLGNLVIGTSGKGIDFSADPSAAGMTSELLDDYEEGTFTPAIAFNNAAVDVTYSTQDGIYTKVGRCVTFTVNIVLTSKGSSTGSMTVTGLPFTSGATYGYGTSFGDWYDFNFLTVSPLYAKINPSNTNVSMFRQASASFVQAITNAEVQNNTQFKMSGYYFV